MPKQCQRCHKKVSDELFICPHCDAILGDPVYKPAPVPKKAKTTKEKQPKRSHSLAWIGPVLLVLFTISLALILPRFLRQSIPDPKPSTTVQTQPTSAPLVTYNVQIKAGNRTTLKGVLIEIYLGDKMIDSCITSQYGKASFTLPQSDDYRLRLKELPIKYQLNYGDTDFAFPKGQQDLIISLENKPIPYIVKVVNEEGEPLPGAGVMFCTFNASKLMVTDEDGCCVFLAKYLDTGYSARLQVLPTGYGKNRDFYDFEEGSNELVITLPRVEDSVPEGEELYTVRVVDDYGQPVTDTLIYIVTDKFTGSMVGNYNSVTSGTLNQDGWFAFTGTPDQNYSVWLPYSPDYYEILFAFDDIKRELLIQLDLEREEYTYTVHVVDQFGDPYPNVEIYLQQPDENICYVTDENGMITFTCDDYDPTKVVLLYYEENDHVEEALKMYTFKKHTRKAEIIITNPDKEIVYTVKVIDQNDQPVIGAVLMITDSIGQNHYAYSDEDGLCIFVLRSCDASMVQILYLPNGYSGDLFAPRAFATGSREKTWVVTSTAEPAQ